jgi:photosystem II stability/assembly factor-like uncharacterized protein
LWEPVTVDGGGYTNFVVVDPYSPNIVYAGVNVGGVYKSNDYGENWMPSNKGLNWPTDKWAAALTIDPKNDTVYLGVGAYDKGGLFKSTDKGESWQLLTRKVRFYGLTHKQSRGKGLIIIDPLDSGTIYAGSHKDGIYKSKDGGDTWFYRGLKGEYISSIVINPINSQKIYVAAVKENKKEGGIYKSIDGGNNWKKLNSKINDVNQLIMNPSNPDTLYAASGIHGVFKTTDGGVTWVKKNKGLEGLLLSKLNLREIKYISLAIDPKNNNVIYTGSGIYRGQIYKSTNGGENWVKLISNKRNIHPGGWWIRKRNMLGGVSYSANSLSIDPKNNKRIYISGRSGIWRSDDGGKEWHAKVNNLGATCMNQIAIHPVTPDTFFVGDGDWVMFRTFDGGKTFDRPLKGIGNWDVEESKNIWRKYKADEGLVFAIDPRNNLFTMYIGTAGRPANTGTIFKSTDSSETWNEANNGLPIARVTAIAIDQTNYNILFAILKDHGLYKTIDGGANWEKLNVDVGIKKMFQWEYNNSILIHPKFANVIYVLDKKVGVYRSVNGGEDWELISRDLPYGGIKGMDQYVGSMAVDYESSDIVYLGLRNHGVYKTTDGGKRWKRITPLYIRHGGAISIDPLDNSIYLASVPGTNDEDIKGFIPGIYKSTDSGNSWHPIHNDDLLRISLKVRFLTVDRGVLYISTQGNGIIVGKPVDERTL